MTFVDSVQRATSTLCVGIDPSRALLEQWRLPPTASGAQSFCDSLLEAATGLVSILKPQSAYFEQFGPEGVAVLHRLIGAAKERGFVVILDCKRGDIPDTMAAYLEAYAAPGRPFRADAITVAPYLGTATVLDGYARIADQGIGVILVARSSNPEATELQEARLSDGRSVAEAVIDDARAFNQRYGGGNGPIGAVIGATLGTDARRLAERLENGLVLAPGFGAQGAQLGDLGRLFGPAAPRVVPNVSRSILKHGPEVADLRQAMRTALSSMDAPAEA